MDVFKRVFGDWSHFKLPFPFGRVKPKKVNSVSKYDYYTYKFQSLVIWEHPSQTVSCMFLIQLLFWMIVNLCWKFYGIIFTLLLIFCTHDAWTEKIWPEIRLPQPDAIYHEHITSNPRILTSSQLEEYINNFLLHVKMTMIRFKNLRDSHPMTFCSMLSSFFASLSIIGCTISGIWLLYMVVMTIFLSPGVYIHILPQPLKDSLKQYLKDFVTFISVEISEVDKDDEYIPNLSTEILNEAYASVFHATDINNDFLSIDRDGIAPPSFDMSSLENFEKFSDKVNLEFSESSSVSSEFAENIKFQGTHFSNADDDLDTSEDDNEKAFLPDRQHRRMVSESSVLNNIVSNLTFPHINELGKNILSNIMTSSSAIQSELSTSRRHKKPAENYNTDDEFEFVNQSDVN